MISLWKWIPLSIVRYGSNGFGLPWIQEVVGDRRSKAISFFLFCSSCIDSFTPALFCTMDPVFSKCEIIKMTCIYVWIVSITCDFNGREKSIIL